MQIQSSKTSKIWGTCILFSYSRHMAVGFVKIVENFYLYFIEWKALFICGIEILGIHPVWFSYKILNSETTTSTSCTNTETWTVLATFIDEHSDWLYLPLPDTPKTPSFNFLTDMPDAPPAGAEAPPPENEYNKRNCFYFYQEFRTENALIC